MSISHPTYQPRAFLLQVAGSGKATHLQASPPLAAFAAAFPAVLACLREWSRGEACVCGGGVARELEIERDTRFRSLSFKRERLSSFERDWLSSFAKESFAMGWLRSVGSIKLYVSLAEFCPFYRALLQKRPVI